MKSRYIPLLMIILISFTHCSKSDDQIEEDTSTEVMATFNIGNLPVDKIGYVIIEDKYANTNFIKLKEGENKILRGTSISGDRVNIHIINVLEKANLLEVDGWNIISYYDCFVGKTISLSSNLRVIGSELLTKNLKTQPICNPELDASLKATGRAKLIFTDIPDYDLVSLSGYGQSHSHTTNDFSTSCVVSRGFNHGEHFYICLQKGDNARYRLDSIPEVDEYTISLGELSDMSKYTIARYPNHSLSIALSSDGYFGKIDMYYNYIYPDSDIEFVNVFAPINDPKLKFFNTRLGFHDKSSTVYFESFYRDNKVVTNYTLSDATPTISHTSGEFPEINISNKNYDILRVDLQWHTNTSQSHSGCNLWTFYNHDGQNLHIPEFPDEIVLVLPLFKRDQLLINVSKIMVSTFKDSRINSYQESLDYYMKTKIPGDEFYSILTAGYQINYLDFY